MEDRAGGLDPVVLADAAGLARGPRKRWSPHAEGGSIRGFYHRYWEEGIPNIAFLSNRLLLLLGIFAPGGSPMTSRKAPWKDPHVRFSTPRTLRKLLEEEACLQDVIIMGERFSLSAIPMLRKIHPRLLRVFDRVLGFLGRVFPSVFGARFFFAGRKGAHSSDLAGSGSGRLGASEETTRRGVLDG